VTVLDMSGYAPLPFFPAVRPGRLGAVYEFRICRLRPGGPAPTLAGWRDAIVPARDYTDHLITNMHALDGPPRITHIWAFEIHEQRARLRANAYDAGAWPPKSGPENILEAVSVIGLPEPMSPLH